MNHVSKLYIYVLDFFFFYIYKYHYSFHLCHDAHPSSVFVFLPPGCENLPWPLCASDSLHLDLLPQFNRQHKGRKEEGREATKC